MKKVVLFLFLLFVNTLDVFASVYPDEIIEIEDVDHYKIIKNYYLNQDQSPDKISKESFIQLGIPYEFTDILKDENISMDKREETETIEISTSTKNIEDILNKLEKTREIITDDGYMGTLELDIGSLQTNIKGYVKKSYEVEEVREYPNLSEADSSLIPKTITKDGKTYNIVDLKWSSTNTSTIDYESLPSNYKATAKYSATVTSNNVTGYITIAEYKGEVSKVITDTLKYSAIFIGEKPIVEEDLEEDITQTNLNIYPILFLILFLGLVIGVLGATIFFLLNSCNKVYNEDEGEFKKIGRVKIKKELINLNKFIKYAKSKKFIIELSNLSFRKLRNKELTVLYENKSVKHLLPNESETRKYQFLADFTEEIPTEKTITEIESETEFEE